MDENSPEKSTEVFNEEDGASLGDKMDLNAYENKDCGLGGLEHESEVPHDDIQVYPSKGYASPPLPLGVVNEEGTQYTLLESNSVGSSLPVPNSEETIGAIERNLGVKDAERKISDYGTEGVRSPSLDHQKHEHDAEAGATIDNYRETEDFNHHQGSPLEQGDVAQYELMDREYYEKHSANSSAPGEAVNDNVGDVSVFPQPEGVVVNEVMDGENLNQKSSHQTPMQEDCYSSRMLPPENGGMVWQNSGLQSLQDTQNVSPSPERRLSVSAERSPHTHSPPKGHASPRQHMESSANFDQKSEPSLRSSTRRHSPSPEKHSPGHKRTSSRDRSFPSARTKSPPERASKREAHHRDDSQRRHLSRSPQKRESSRRRGRSTSKSPMRRDSPGRDQHNAQRDHHRSRSRSPIARDRSRKSPRRNSPRRRSSPTYPSRHRSLRRQWSPPANRNTGTGRPGKKLFVAGFSYVTTERDLERKFSKFGRVTDVHIARDRRSGDSRGFGFLSFELDVDADAAIQALDQTEWNGRIVLVEKSKTSAH